MSDTAYFVIQVQVPQARVDLVQGQLYRLGCLGLIEEEATGAFILLKAYFPEQIDNKFMAADALKQLIAVETGCVVQSVEGIRLNASQFQPAPFDPIRLAGDYWIVPPEDMQTSPQPPSWQGGELPLIIRPGMAFGTGRHETTQLCADAILSAECPQSLLDVGTGSGVLAILAAKIGVPQVSAVEISADARKNAQENFILNSIPSIELLADISEVRGRYSLVVANILAPTILQLKENLLECLAASGHLILSGITIGEDAAIEDAFSDLHLLTKTELEGWYCMSYIAEPC